MLNHGNAAGNAGSSQRRAIQAALELEEIAAICSDGLYRLDPAWQYPGTTYFTGDVVGYSDRYEPAIGWVRTNEVPWALDGTPAAYGTLGVPMDTDREAILRDLDGAATPALSAVPHM